MALCKAEETLAEALTGFDFGGQIVGAVRYGKGHINDTFCVYTQNEEGDCVRFILQRINTDTFFRGAACAAALQRGVSPRTSTSRTRAKLSCLRDDSSSGDTEKYTPS